jgi:hypothetical protein
MRKMTWVDRGAMIHSMKGVREIFTALASDLKDQITCFY